jgi:hypothetical protein
MRGASVNIKRSYVRLRRNKAIFHGLWISIGWVAVCVGYVLAAKGWDKFWAMDPNNFGDFVAGVSAPIAFFWIALGLSPVKNRGVPAGIGDRARMK